MIYQENRYLRVGFPAYNNTFLTENTVFLHEKSIAIVENLTEYEQSLGVFYNIFQYVQYYRMRPCEKIELDISDILRSTKMLNVTSASFFLVDVIDTYMYFSFNKIQGIYPRNEMLPPFNIPYKNIEGLPFYVSFYRKKDLNQDLEGLKEINVNENNTSDYFHIQFSELGTCNPPEAGGTFDETFDLTFFDFEKCI